MTNAEIAQKTSEIIKKFEHLENTKLGKLPEGVANELMEFREEMCQYTADMYFPAPYRTVHLRTRTNHHLDFTAWRNTVSRFQTLAELDSTMTQEDFVQYEVTKNAFLKAINNLTKIKPSEEQQTRLRYLRNQSLISPFPSSWE